ncbi:antibiotic biosynthesis monooxygenase [Phragmitibacter flavus]|uniref:Antibiotic biosynthesis monooxygenase n=1 Tax=Phragmitibacter flavus TaxID=2576071 RepID=A0A5R8KGG8_9BACT|nr:antibiotic biosynthesis monooxygenase [Phragmitibacter flavus]TLD71398.1 antibiotic biosynthesis monooxygenase [Phragmitibacter flavus]
MDDESVHIAVVRRVRPERVKDFEAALGDFARVSLAEPGARGIQCLYPAPGAKVQEYGIMRTFANAAARDAFYASEAYHRWEKTIEPMVEGTLQIRELHGLEAWFRHASDGSPPPRWKMALLTWLAVWPVSMGIAALVLPLLGGLMHKVLVSGVIAAGITATLTWVAMPVLVKAAHGWLHPNSEDKVLQVPEKNN